MSFLYPLGLLGLIGIPILIIIYIIKNKYTEQVVSSTYIWTLSEKFLKRRNPINKLVGIISLILQILAVLFVSVAVARPVFVVPASAYEYVFVLDASGSMNISENGATRFELAKKEIDSRINSSLGGSSFTLVCVGNTTDTVFEQITDKKYALKLLDELEECYLETGYAEALDYVQNYFDTVSRSAKICLLTDKDVQYHFGVDVVNVAVNSSAVNYAVTGVKVVPSDGKTVVTGKAVSYGGDAELTVAIDVETGSGEKIENSAKVKVEKTGDAQFAEGTFELAAECISYNFVKVGVTDRDAMELDNYVTVYSPEAEEDDEDNGVLIVGEQTGMLNSALSVRPDITTTQITPAEYGVQYSSGYKLYIFDGMELTELPKDGAIWIFNPKNNLSDLGFNIQETVSYAEGVKLKYSEPHVSPAVDLLMKNLPINDIMVTEYVRCGFTRSFSTLLSHEGNPLVFAGTTSSGAREVVTAFDIHKSSLPGAPDFPILIGNYLSYTFPNIFEETTYYAGETVSLNVAANCDSIRVESPNGDVTYLNTGSDVTELLLTKVGVYTVTITESGVKRIFYVHAALPEGERIPLTACEEFGISGEPLNEKRDGTYDDLLAWFIVIAVLLAADWMVYCYEQYQLR